MPKSATVNCKECSRQKFLILYVLLIMLSTNSIAQEARNLLKDLIDVQKRYIYIGDLTNEEEINPILVAKLFTSDSFSVLQQALEAQPHYINPDSTKSLERQRINAQLRFLARNKTNNSLDHKLETSLRNQLDNLDRINSNDFFQQKYGSAMINFNYSIFNSNMLEKVIPLIRQSTQKEKIYLNNRDQIDTLIEKYYQLYLSN